MCGIAGKLHWGEGYVPGLAQRMADSIAHRGPDDQGIMELTEIALGHRRLSIIDLSANARQPMINVEQSHWIVFNGEIYNYQPIRKELEVYESCIS